MQLCDFNKDAKQVHRNHTSAWVFFRNLLHIFRIPFYKNTSEWLFLKKLLLGYVSLLYSGPKSSLILSLFAYLYYMHFNLVAVRIW